ncbi:substrate-binding domain-containing protein, partial [Petrotoga sibirica]
VKYLINQFYYTAETSDEVFNLIMSLLSLPKNNIPTAIFCSNDLVAMQVIMAAKKLNLDIPNDISLIGFDDADFAQALEISTFRHPKQQFGEKAAQMLLKMIEENNNGKPEKIVEKAEFIERNSLIQKK